MTIIDRYIVKQLFLTLVFSLAALSMIFILVNLLENLDEFLDKDLTFKTIVLYYVYYLPDILKIITPVALLVSVLFTVGKLSTLNEITAMKSGGVSLYRLMVPLAIFSVIISGGQLYFNGWVVPRANEKKIFIEEKHLHKRISGGPIYNLYFRDDPKTNVIMRYYDATTKTGSNVAIERYRINKRPVLESRMEARKIEWDSVESAWIMYAGVERDFTSKGAETEPFKKKITNLKITHNKIVQLQRSPEEMNFNELRDYIALLKQGGKDVRKQMIEYYGGYAFPFANFIVVLFGAPFASVRRKGGLAIQIGAALILSFAYLVFSKISQTMGYAADINPILAGWGANIIFFIIGLITILKTKT